ncbi:MAG: Ig-like domain-containing protein, partial [Gemmatimonadaceae bacterium]
QTVTLTGTAYNAAGDVLSGRTIAWSSSDESIATVDVSGVVTGVGPGGAVITGTAEGKQGTATVTVSAVPVARVEVQPAADTLVLGDSVQLTATAFDAAGNVITGRTPAWSGSSSVAIVTSDGQVFSRASGTAKITATIDGKSGAATITVIPPPVASVTVAPADTSIIVGTTATLVATLKDATGKTLTGRTIKWSSSDASVASVTATGVVTGVVASATAVTITATSEGQSGTASVTVNPLPVALVTVLPAAPIIVAGDSVQLTATGFDAGSKPIPGLTFTWTSSDEAVATVSATGMVTSLMDGLTTITAATSGKSGTSLVTVHPVPVARVSIAPTDTTVVIFSTVQFTATAYDKRGNVLAGRPVVWTTSNGVIVSVDSAGLASTHLTGKAKITAKSEKQNAVANITVKLPLLGDRDGGAIAAAP